MRRRSVSVVGRNGADDAFREAGDAAHGEVIEAAFALFAGGCGGCGRLFEALEEVACGGVRGVPFFEREGGAVEDGDSSVRESGVFAGAVEGGDAGARRGVEGLAVVDDEVAAVVCGEGVDVVFLEGVVVDVEDVFVWPEAGELFDFEPGG